MLIETIFAILAITILVLASIFDLKTREVPDYLSYSFISAALGISLLHSTYEREPLFFLLSIITAGIIFGLGYILYRAKQMGGADVKLLTALGVVFANQTFLNLPLAFIFLFLVIILGSLYTFFWGLAIYIKNWKIANRKAKEFLQEKKLFRIGLMFFALLVFILLFFIENTNIKILLASFTLLCILSFYLFIFIKVIENIHFIVKIPIDKLTEGDWLAKEVKINGKIICSTRSPCIDKKQIEILKKAKVDSVFIKVGIPFVPAILFATIATILITYL